MRTQACKKLNLDCKYRSDKPKEPYMPHEAFDIEELGEIGKSLKICPYYQNKMAAVDGDLILMPYNYLLSKRLREGMGLKLKDSIIIIDEAHNIANAAESVMEVEIRETTIDVIISELRSYANHTTVKHTRVREILEIINRFRTGL